MSLVFIISWLQPFPDSSSARHCIWFLFFTALSMNFDSFLRILSSDWSFFGYCSSNLSSNSATTLVNTTGTDFPLFTGPIKSIFWNNTLRFSHPRIFSSDSILRISLPPITHRNFCPRTSSDSNSSKLFRNSLHRISPSDISSSALPQIFLSR